MASKTVTKETKYSKTKILKSNEFSNTDKYLLTAMLANKNYSIDEAKKILEKEKKRGVK